MNDCDHSHRLSDEQMRSYLTEGYLVLKSGLPQEVHDHIRDRCEEIFSTTGNPGNSAIIDMLLKAVAHVEFYRRKNALMALEVLLG